MPDPLVYLENYLPMTLDYLASNMVPKLTPRELQTRLNKFALKISDGWYVDTASFGRIVRNRFGPQHRAPHTIPRRTAYR